MNQVISSVCELSIFYWFNKKYKIKKHENLRKIISFIIIFGVVKVEDYFHVSNLLLLTCTNFVMYVVIFCFSYEQKVRTIMFRNTCGSDDWRNFCYFSNNVTYNAL